MKNVEVPKTEIKKKRLILPVTDREHNAIMQYCKAKKLKFTELIRFALKQTINF